MTTYLSPDKVIALNLRLSSFCGGTARIMLYTCSHGKLIVQLKSDVGDEAFIRCFWIKRICCQNEWKIEGLRVEQRPDRVNLYEQQSVLLESGTFEMLTEYDFVKEFTGTKIER